MAIKIKFDNNNNAIPPTLVLANRNGNKLGYIPARNIVTADNLNEYSELQFKVYKTENNTDYPLWDDVQDFRLAWCPEWDVYFEIYVEIDETNSICKNVTAKSLGEAELSQVNLYNIEINTETDISRDDYKPTVLYDSDDPDASLLTRLLDKAPHYSIDHVDDSIKNIQRTFTFNDKTIYDAFQEISEEIGCIFIFDSSDDEGKPARKISVYDMETVCGTCGYRGVFDGDTCPSCGGTDLKHGYGDDTTIFVTVENLAESINYSSDVDSVKNCFKVEGGDDLMSATVINCNPNGSAYIWNLTDAVRADMSDELRTKLAQYDSLYADYRDTHVTTLDSNTVSAYNALVRKYNAIIDADSGIKHERFNEISTSITGYPNLLNALYETIDMQLFLESVLMPGVDIGSSAADEVAKLNHLSSLQFVAVKSNNYSLNTASNAVIALAKTYLDDGYAVKIKPGSTSLTGSVWKGVLTVTGYSDSDDTANTNQISLTVTSDYITYVKQNLTKTLHNGVDGPSDITELFKLDQAEFIQEIKKYCLASLISFRDACQACMNILIEQNSTQNASGVNLYGTVYVPYYNKYNALQSEINLRNNEIAIVTGAYDSQGMLSVNGMQTIISDANAAIQNTLNFENFVGETLWKEFVSYRREQLYSNDNYISDGLDNKELFDRARELIEAATKELYKSSHLQHSITATLENLLFMKEFQPIVDYFCVGNWIRLRVDGEIYKLRLISYQIDHDNPASLAVEFSDIIRTADGTSDLESIVNQASSMATSYDSVMHQASKGKQSKDEMDVWVDRGLSLTLMKIMSNAENQKLLIDENGVLARQYDDITEDYDDKQLRIINRGIYMTDDAWKTMRSGIGDFVYYDPETGAEVQSYGVIADTLVGKLMLSNKVYVYNRGGSIKLDENGLTLVSTKNGVSDVFKVKSRATAQWGTAASASMKNVVSSYVSDKSLADATVDVYVQATEPDASEANANDLFVDSTTNKVYYCDASGEENVWTQYGSSTISGLSIGKYQLMVYEDAPSKFEPGDWWYEPTSDTLEIAKSVSGDEDVIWMDNAGNAHFKGTIDAANGSFTGAVTATSLTIVNGSTDIDIDDYIAAMSIATYAQDEEPTEGMHDGDLWCDTADGNKLYRYDGENEEWVDVQDEDIATAYATANGVKNGTDGIDFYTSATHYYTDTYGRVYNANKVTINSTVGVKVLGTTGEYFQATSGSMGFYDRSGNALMYVSGGNATFTGRIQATEGYFSGNIYAANLASTSTMTFNGSQGFYYSGGMHVNNLTIDGNCTIKGALDGATGTFSGNLSANVSTFKQIQTSGVTTAGSYTTIANNGFRMYNPTYGMRIRASTFYTTGEEYTKEWGSLQLFRGEIGENPDGTAVLKSDDSAVSHLNPLGLEVGKRKDNQRYDGNIYCCNVYAEKYYIGNETSYAEFSGGGGSSITVSATDYVSDPNAIAIGSITINGRTTNYKMPPATQSYYGMVKYDNSTIKVNSSGQLYVASGGGGGTSYSAGDGISISSNTISVDYGSGLGISNGKLYVTSVPTTNVRVEYGTISFSSEDTTVSFTNSFSSTPTVTVTLVKAESVNIGYSVHGRTTSGFQLSKKGDTSSRSFCWIAVGT